VRIPLAYLSKPENLKIVIDWVLDDRILAYPTDTLYGMGGRFSSHAVIHTIDRLKGRGDTPYSVAVSGRHMMETLVERIPPQLARLFEQLFPGPYTVLLPADRRLDRHILDRSDKIGIRIPAIPSILRLIETIGIPIISTSVNLSGGIPLTRPEDIQVAFPDIGLLIDAGELPPSQGSTILDFCVEPPRLVRRGDGFSKLARLGLDFSPAT